MNTRSGSTKTNGAAVVVTMVLLTIGMIFVGLYLSRVSQELKLSRNQMDYQQSCLLAARGLDYGVLKLKDIVAEYQLSPTWSTNYLQSRLDQIPPPSDWGEFHYLTPDGRVAFKIRATSDITDGTITNGLVGVGSLGSFQYFTVSCGCGRQGNKSAVIQQTVQAKGLQLIRFGVFYDPDLEIVPGANMQFYGPVHANGNLYIGGAGAGITLDFYDRVTAHGNVYAHRKDTNTYWSTSVVNTNGTLVSNLQDGSYIDSDYGNWMTRSVQLWQGNLMSSAHGVPDLAPPIGQQDSTNNHVIVERPNTTNTVAVGMQMKVSTNVFSQQTEDEKLANKAALKIYVNSNGQFTAIDFYTNDVTAYFTNVVLATNTTTYTGKSIYSKTNNGNYVYATNSPANGAYDIKQTNFYDARQLSTMAPVDIYVDKLMAAYPAFYTGTTYPAINRGVVYVTRDKPATGPTAGKPPCVRIRNGSDLSGAQYGLTFASDLPVYVEGNYNTNKSLLSNTNVPALVAGDAVTMLSTNWNDAYSAIITNAPKKQAASTTYNTVIMTGCRNTATNDYNGGLENVLRFLEDWSGKTMTYRGSIIDLWFSKSATNRWYYGTAPDGRFRYNAPSRNWGYDNIYRTQHPPGMTRVYGMEELEWTRTTWTATTDFW